VRSVTGQHPATARAVLTLVASGKAEPLQGSAARPGSVAAKEQGFDLKSYFNTHVCPETQVKRARRERADKPREIPIPRLQTWISSHPTTLATPLEGHPWQTPFVCMQASTRPTIDRGMKCTAYAKSLGLQRLLPSALSPSPLLIAGGPADRLADGRVGRSHRSAGNLHPRRYRTRYLINVASIMMYIDQGLQVMNASSRLSGTVTM
jgi:hypothetical protein